MYNTRSKVLTFGTAAGGNDALEIKLTERNSGYNKVVFESDIYTNFISCSSGKPQYHIFFETASGIAYQFRIVLENGKLTFRDHDNTSQGANVPSSISANEWFNLRIEIELSDADSFKAICIVNGKKLFESNHYYGKGEGKSLYNSVERIRFYTMSPMSADISFDNVSLAQKLDEIQAPEDDADFEAKVLPIKGGASGIVVLMHDDGELVSASILDTIYKKYSLRGNVALIADRVYDVVSDTPLDAKVTSWKSLFANGRWQLTSHSKTHDFWGINDDDGKITDEIVGSQTILRNLFSDQRVLTFAYPGFSEYEQTYTQDEIYGIAKELVSKNYISGRYFGSEGAFETEDVDWSFVIAESIGQSYLNQTLSTIDDAANGKMAIIFMHQVCQDTESVPSQTVTYSHMNAIAERISSYVKDGSVWNAFYEDAVMYLKEAESAKLETTRSENDIRIVLTDELPDNVYNYPLTVRISVPENWEAVKVIQGDKVTYVASKTVNGSLIADVEIVPNGVEATVVSANISDVPKGDDNSDVTDGGCIDFENSAIGGDVAINGDASLAISGSTVSGFDKLVTKDPSDSKNNVYKVSANALSSNSHVYVDRSSKDSDIGSYYIFSTKLYLDANLDGTMLPASNSFATLDFRIKGTSNIFYTVNLRRIRTNRNTPEESRALVFTPKSDLNTYLNSQDFIAFNTWVDLTIEMYIQSESNTATIKFYLGKKLIATDSTSINASLINEIPTRVDLKYISGTSSVTYFDEVDFIRTNEPFIKEENTDSEAELDLFDFEANSVGDVSSSSVKGGVNMSLSTTSDSKFKAVIESSTGGKYLAIENNASTSNRHVRFDFDTSKGNSSGNVYTMKTKIYFNSQGAVHDANFADIDFRTTGGALLYTARMFWCIKDGVTTVSLRSNSKTDDYGEFVSDIPTDKWIEFEMVCRTYLNENGENAVDADIIVDGTRLGGHTGLTLSGATASIAVDIDRFNIKTNRNTYSKFYVDDLFFTRQSEKEKGGE